jgi:class 3 adenylate cyclase
LYLPGMRDMEREGWLHDRLEEEGESELEREVTGQMSGLYRFAKTEVGRRHGVLDVFDGDCMRATFGVADGADDHCVQALETALALRDEAPAWDQPLAIAVAVATAESDIGARDVSTSLATELQATAADGEIVLNAAALRRVYGYLAQQGLLPQRREVSLESSAEPQVVYVLPAPAQLETAAA